MRLGMLWGNVHRMLDQGILGMVRVKPIGVYNIKDLEEFKACEEKFLKEGYEGIMARSPHAPYKVGRSTLKEQGLLKIKRF